MEATRSITSSKTSHAITYAGAQNGAAHVRHAERDTLIEMHLPLVKATADRLAAKLPASVDRDDLIGAGMIGLLDAVDKFDPSRGVMFKTYAEMRVRGAMLDSLRDLDWAPRSMRRRAREVEAAYLEIEQRAHRVATEDEVAARLGMKLPEFHRLLSDLRGLSVTTLDYAEEEDSNTRQKHPLIGSTQTPLMQYEKTETREQLAAAIDKLPERERRTVALYYLEELNMKEIGQVLGVTESRVSQIHTQAVLRLRAALSQALRGGKAVN